MFPYGLPFASTDVYDSNILDEVFDQDHIEKVIATRDTFRSGFVVVESSPALQFLDARVPRTNWLTLV